MAVKPGFKQTLVGAIPEDWEVSQLGALAETSSGTTPARALNERYFKNGSIAWVKTMDLTNSEIFLTSESVTELAIKETCLRLYPVGTVLVAMYGGFQQIGRTGLLRTSASVNQAITAVQPKTDRLVSEYLIETLNYQVDYWKSVASSSRKDPNISSQDIRNFPIAYPRPPEQRAIAEALSDMDALLGALERLIAKKRDIKQAAMQQLLTGQTRFPGFHGEWEVKRLGEIAEIVMGQSPSSSNYNLQGDGLPLIQGNADIANRKTIKRVFTSQITKRGRAGDTLMSVRAPVGEVSRATFDFCIGRGVCAIRYPNDFLYHYLIFLEPTWAKHSKGSTFESVNSTDVRAAEIQQPSDLREQTAIAAVLSDMDAELAALEQRLTKTRALKQGMMQELLTGRTRLL